MDQRFLYEQFLQLGNFDAALNERVKGLEDREVRRETRGFPGLAIAFQAIMAFGSLAAIAISLYAVFHPVLKAQ